jgi:hypothetical protein
MSYRQPDLFAAPPARHISTPINYQDTSGLAYASMRGIGNDTVNHEILMAYYNHGPLTDQQVEELLRKPEKHSTISGNRRHLVENGFVVYHDEEGLTRAGRKAIRWTLTPAGRGYLKWKGWVV